MKENGTFTQKLERFLAGRGFYIVLAACVLVIAVSAWSLYSSGVFHRDETPLDVSVGVTPDTPVQQNKTVEKKDNKRDTASVWQEKSEPKTDEPAVKDEGDEVLASVTLPADTPVMNKPLFVPPLEGEICCAYSDSRLQYNKTMGDWRIHDGVDIEADIGTDVVAVADGKVKSIYDDDLLGRTVIIDHGDGIESFYSNLAKDVPVSVGDAVFCGGKIATVGDTAIGECAEVSHLHFSMQKDGSVCNPFDYVP